jgi:hypothetical protein
MPASDGVAGPTLTPSYPWQLAQLKLSISALGGVASTGPDTSRPVAMTAARMIRRFITPPTGFNGGYIDPSRSRVLVARLSHSTETNGRTPARITGESSRAKPVAACMVGLVSGRTP